MSKGLKALRKLEKELSEYYGTDIAYYPETFKMFSTISNELKALEIVKKKGVCLPALKLTASFEKDNLEEYNKLCLKHYALQLTQKEYDLLRGVLL